MWKCLAAVLTAGVLSLPLEAQQGTAPDGFYPNSYAGATFTGVFQPDSSDALLITLVYTRGSKSETFVGKLAATCASRDKNGSVHNFDASMIPTGTVLTAYYVSVTKKSDGRKSTENSVIGISYVEIGGKKVPDEKRRIIYFCTTERIIRTMGFGPRPPQ